VKVRPITEEDLPLLAKFTVEDPWHRDAPTLENMSGACTVEDDQGVVFFVFLEQVARVHVQFGGDRDRIRETLGNAFREISQTCKEEGYTEMIYQSESPLLIKFLQKYGFQPMKDEYSVRLDV